MTHVIIPTDFSVASLQPIHEAVAHCAPDALDITMLHLLQMPSSTGDLLFRLRGEKSVRIPEAFFTACEIMANKYEARVARIRPLIRFGSTVSFAENLLRGLGADFIFLPPHRKSRAACNTAALLMQCSIPVIITAPDADREQQPVAGLGALLRGQDF